MNFDLQPMLENELIKLVPLKEDDFESLFSIAADPLIWDQHPNKERYKREVFENFFQGAIASNAAFIVYDQKTGNVVGSSRYYELDEENSTITIGYTFIGRNYWGKGYNAAMKKLMLNHAFKFVNKVELHIGATNFRSQKAAEKLGAVKIGEQDITYFGEQAKWNFIYQINKDNWLNRESKL